MALNPDGFFVLERIPISQHLRQSFVDLPPDPYCPGRFRRFSQFQMRAARSGGWDLRLLPSRPLIQPKRNNGYIGGVRRFLEPLVADILTLVEHIAHELELDHDAGTWQLDAHQWRTLIERENTVLSVPEGIHSDGHLFGAVIVVERHNIRGGLTSLYYPTEPPHRFFETLLSDEQGLLFDDSRLLHFTSELQREQSGTAYRDIFVLDFNRWDQKRYGSDFEMFAAHS